jgi:hypothetical protein
LSPSSLFHHIVHPNHPTFPTLSSIIHHPSLLIFYLSQPPTPSTYLLLKVSLKAPISFQANATENRFILCF